MKKAGFDKFSFLVIPLLFLLFSSPTALDYVFHYPDEKYYTDAVLQMMDKGDIFTPYQADGTPRFKKPILTYWVLMGSYKLFGVSRISSRLFFWLAGALLVLITYFMSKSLSGKIDLAIIAAFITASNPLVILSASRSIPDILLVLFLTISAWGFLEILISIKPKRIFYWMAYVGAALAFETKGIPALAFAGVSLLFLLMNPWKKKKLKQILDPYSIVVAIIIALSWFIVMYYEHGSSYFTTFYADQVGERVSSKTYQVIKNTTLGVINLILFLIPWILIIFSKPARIKIYVSASTLQSKAVIAFIITWIVMIIIMSGAVFKFYDRYVLPVIPMVSFLFAGILLNSESGLKKIFIKIFLVLNIVVVIINITYSIFILPDLVLISGTILSILLFAFWVTGFLKNISKEAILATQILFLFFNVFLLLYPLLMPNPGQQLVDNLIKQGITSTQKVYVYGNIRTASNIRIHSNNSFDVVSMDTLYSLPMDKNHFLVFTKKEQERLNLDGYEVTSGSEEWHRVPVYKFPIFLQKSISGIKESGTKYYIAKPKSPGNEKP